MTRINIIPPQLLADQHLLAENKEILQLCGQYKKSLKSKKGIYGIPMSFTLGKGHVKFFYDKLMYLHKRFLEVQREMKERGFTTYQKFDTNFILKRNHYQDYKPTLAAHISLIVRISQKLENKPGYYKYKGQDFDMKKWALSCKQVLLEESCAESL
jgi:deoxyribonuclease (pyrimidine dimer)